MTRQKCEFYAVENDVRKGRYPGKIVSRHGSHSDAVEEMLRLNRASAVQADMLVTP